MNLNQLNYFVKLAQLEHYTKAAEELSISQPSLSHAISSLENELGVKLFEKKGRGIVLTKYGAVFREYAEQSLHTLGLGVKKVQEMTGQTEGMVELGYIYTLGTRFVPELVRDFLRMHEELHMQFHFTVGNTEEIIRGLKEEVYDIAFCSFAEDEPDITFTRVSQEKLVVVVPKGHPMAKETMADLKTAGQYPQVYYTRSSGLRPVVDQMYRQAGVSPKIEYEIEEDGAMAGLVAQNFGIAVMPEVPILTHLDVVVLPIRDHRQQRYIYMAMRTDHYQPPLVARFAEYAIERGLGELEKDTLALDK